MSQHPSPWGPWHPAHGHTPQTPVTPRDDLMRLWSAARTGAVVGACGAGALNIHRMRNQGMTWQQALTDTATASVKAGVATAAAAAVGQMLVRNPVLSAAATLATGTATMYMLTDATKEAENE